MPKKVRNGYFFFMREVQEKHRKEGRNFSMAQLQTLASPLWKELTPEQKITYNDMAKAYKKGDAYGGAKLQSDGTPIVVHQAEMEAMMQEEKQEEWNLMQYVQANEDAEFFKLVFPDRRHYIIIFNSYCVHEDFFIPAEVGLVEYSFRKGISAKYHRIIDPGRFPAGCAGPAKSHSEESHQLMFSEVEKDKDWEKIWAEIIAFVTPLDDHEPENVPPIFTSGHYMVEQTVGCLRWLAYKAGAESADFFRIWKLENFLYDVRLAAGEPILSPYIATELLSKSTFDYQVGTRCDFHEEQDSRYCALNVAQRLCFLLSDSACACFDVELTNNHIPNRAEEVKCYQVQYGGHPSKFTHGSVPRPTRNFTRPSGSDDDDEESQYSQESASSAYGSRQYIPPQQSVAGIGRGLSHLKLDVTYSNLTRGIGRGQPR